MINQQLSEIFFEMADILEMQNVQWKPQAYRNVAILLSSMKMDVAEIYKKDGLKGLNELSGIGENIAKKIEEFILTGKIQRFEELKTSIPAHLNLLMKVPGLGPKKVRKLNELLQVQTLEQLKEAASTHKIASLKGFGKKSESDIIESIGLMQDSTRKTPLKSAERIARKIIFELKKLIEIDDISVAGSVRRKKAFIGDIDIITSSANPDRVIDTFTRMADVKKIMAKGSTKATVIIHSGIQADIRVFKPESYGAGLFYFTGSKNYNIEMRKIAIKKGWKLNEYGLFDSEGNMLAGKTEQEICDKLGVKYLKPEKREV